MAILTRSDWGSNVNPPAGYAITGPVNEIYIHHFNSNIIAVDNITDGAARMRGAQNYHNHTNGWGDIGYSWCVDQAGNIYEGRGWWKTGAHTYGFNSQGYGLCWLGDSRLTDPTPEALRALATIIRMGIEVGAVRADPTIVAHRDRVPDTSCCGPLLYAQLDSIRHLVATGSTPTPITTPIPAPEEDLFMFTAYQTPDGTIYLVNLITRAVTPLMEAMPSGADWPRVQSTLTDMAKAGLLKTHGEAQALYAIMDWDANYVTRTAP